MCMRWTVLANDYKFGFKYENVNKKTVLSATTQSYFVDKNLQVSRLTPVSYTHLDVYKRQWDLFRRD